MKKRISIGRDDYRNLIENNGYYVDKTLLIKEFLENDAMVTLITRPRRFGKTLNLTMVREFLDITKNSKDIFEDTKIMQTEYAEKLNSTPVIFMSFKDCGGDTKDELISRFRLVIKEEYEKYYRNFKDIDTIDKFVFKEFFNMFDILSNIT